MHTTSYALSYLSSASKFANSTFNVISYRYDHYYMLSEPFNIEMVCQFHKNTLLILFSTILISGVLCFTELQSIHLEAYGLQNANYLILKYATIQNTNPNSNNGNIKN